jgi:hypothetical protein
VWELKEDVAGGMRLEIFKGPYQAYLAARVAKPVVVEVLEKPAIDGDGFSAPSSLSKNEQRRRAEALAAVEKNITATEVALVELGEALQVAAATQDYAELQRLTAEYQAAERRLEQLFGEWEALPHEPAVDRGANG